MATRQPPPGGPGKGAPAPRPGARGYVGCPGDSAGADLRVVVQQTRFRPGDLGAEATRLAGEHRDVVAAATARPEGDGVDVLVPPAVAETAGGADAALSGVRSAF